MSRSLGSTQRVRLREIAARAGVSISTVSRTLSDGKGVRAELRQLVQEAAQELGYRRAASHSDSKQLGLYTHLGEHGLILDTFNSDILSGIRSACEAQGYSLRFKALELNNPRSLQAALEDVDALEGAILLAVDDSEVVRAIVKDGFPAVLINAEHPDLAVDTVLPDNYSSTYEAVRYLLQKGHRQIAHATHLIRPTIKQRFRAYQQALEDAGLPYDPALLIELPSYTQGVPEAFSQWLDTDPHFDAVFCAADTIAIGVLQTLQARGIRVPEDVSVVGYDDLPLATLTHPPLTSVRIEREALGQVAVQTLLLRLKQPQLPAMRTELRSSLIERASVGQR